MKITVICRVEPGCLGPDGANHIVEFCKLGQKEFDLIDTEQVIWEVVPRLDKSKAEIQYKLNDRYLSEQQASLYLKALGKDPEIFEDTLFKQLAESVNNYFGR